MKPQNSFKTRNKPHDNKENPFNAYKANKPNLNNKLSDKRINKKTSTSSTSDPHKNKSSTLSNIKPIYSYKETLNKAYSRLLSCLQSYNISNNEINKKIINDIIFDERKRIVSIFKDHLLWNETSDFFKQYYKMHKSVRLMLGFIKYYEAYTKFYPEYGPLEDVLKIMKKNLKRKKKYLEKPENDDEEKKCINDKNKDFERLIKESEIKINNNDSSLQKKNSKTTLLLDSIDKSYNNKDFYFILKEFDYYDDITLDKKEVFNSKNLKNNDNYDSIYIFNSKLAKYVKKNVNEEKNKENKKNRNIFIEEKSNKRFLSISPNLNILNSFINKSIRAKSKEERIGKKIKMGILNSFPLTNTYNHSLKGNHHKCNENKSYSKMKQYNTIKNKVKAHLLRVEPHNIKKIFNSSNKYEKNLISNYFRNNTDYTRIAKSPKSINNLPLNLTSKMNNLLLSSVKNKKRNILNYDLLYKANNNCSLRILNKMKNNSEIKNKKDSSYYNINSNNICIKLKNNKFAINSKKEIKISKKNTTKKISPIHNNNNYSTKIKKKKDLNSLKNPFIIENNSMTFSNHLLNSSLNKNIFYNNKKIPYLITDYNNIKKDIKIESKNKEKLKKRKNKLILIKSNINIIDKNYLNNYSLNNKNNKKLANKKSMTIQTNKSNNKSKNKFIINNNSKKDIIHKKNNNIIKKATEKSLSKNELNINLKISNNSILKSYFFNKNNNNSIKKNKKNGKLVYDNSKIDNNIRNSHKKFCVLNLDENCLIKNKIKEKNETTINNSSKKARTCVRLPKTSSNQI